MKGDFVLKLIKSIGGFGIDVYDTWQWQPIYYKGWKVSGPDRRRVYGDFKN